MWNRTDTFKIRFSYKYGSYFNARGSKTVILDFDATLKENTSKVIEYLEKNTIAIKGTVRLIEVERI